MVVLLRDEVFHELVEMIEKLNGTVIQLMERLDRLKVRLNMLEHEKRDFDDFSED